MKKFTFIFAALFAATMLNAQITLEHTIEGGANLPDNIAQYDRYGNFFAVHDYAEDESESYIFYDLDDYSLIGELQLLRNDNAYTEYGWFSQGIFTTNNIITFIYEETSRDGNNRTNTDTHIWVKDMSGNIIADLGYCYAEDQIKIIKTPQGQFKLLLEKKYVEYIEGESYPKYSDYTEIYSLPGSGNVGTGLSDAPVMRHNNTRKYLHKEQVRIENADHTYTLSGQEVK